MGVRRVWFCCGACVRGGVRGPEAFAARSTGPVPLPTLYVNYTDQCTFTVVNDAGQPVTSIAPGQYELDVTTPILFRMLAPGGPGEPERLHRLQGVCPVPDDGAGCERLLDARQRLQLGQRHRHLDASTELDLHTRGLEPAGRTKMTITTLAGGTPQLPTTEPLRRDVGEGHTLDGPDRIERARPRRPRGEARDERQAHADAERQAGLKLRSGRYSFAIADRDRKGGVSLQVNVKDVAATELSGKAFVGTKKTTVVLSAGRWTVSAAGSRAYTLTVT